MKHLGTKEIKTDRIILREFQHNDVNYAFKNWCNDEKVTKYLTWPAHCELNVTESVINSWIKSYEKKNFYQWAIVLKDINEPIGSIAVTEINEKVNCVDIGYCIGVNWWNKGIVTEALTAVITFLFEEAKVNKIQARHDPKNINSGKVMLKCGLKYEGTLRQSDFNNQGIVDAAYYGLLSSEYGSE